MEEPVPPKRSLLVKDGLLTPQLYLMLSTAIEMLGADKGNIQFYDGRSKALMIVAQIGFNDEFLMEFAVVRPGLGTCGYSFKHQQRTVVEDVYSDPVFAYLMPSFRKYGLTAVQSTPLLDEKSKIFAILSTHFTKRCRPSDAQFEALDEYLKKAVPIILRRKRVVKMKLSRDLDLFKEHMVIKEKQLCS